MEDWIIDLEPVNRSNRNSNIYLPPKGKRKMQTINRKPYFMGIHFNKWHLVFALIAIDATWVILTAAFGGNLWRQFFYLLIGVCISHWLQSWNEIRQAYDPFLASKYGSWSHFLVDSQKDWYYYWRGVWASPIPILIWVIVRAI